MADFVKQKERTVTKTQLTLDYVLHLFLILNKITGPYDQVVSKLRSLNKNNFICITAVSNTEFTYEDKDNEESFDIADFICSDRFTNEEELNKIRPELSTKKNMLHIEPYLVKTGNSIVMKLLVIENINGKFRRTFLEFSYSLVILRDQIITYLHQKEKYPLIDQELNNIHLNLTSNISDFLIDNELTLSIHHE